MLKTVSDFALSDLSLSLTRFSFGIAFGHRIDSGGELFARGKNVFAGLKKTPKRISPKRHELFSSLESIPQAPEL